MLKRLGICMVIAAGGAASAFAQDVTRMPVEDFRILLVSAIDSPTGEAHGILIGQTAQALTSRLKASSPILIDVSTLRRYRQPGCSRLNVRFSQQGVVLLGSREARTQTLDLGLNYCRDGQPPRSLA
jgi:hypothetical protein